MQQQLTNNLVVIFDSGIGGISVLHEIVKQNTNLRFLYIADSRYLPYGDKSAEFIKERCVKLTEFAIKQQAAAVVIACNTATAYAAAYLRDLYPNLPILGVEPALKPAVNITKNGKIGVLATSNTINSQKFADLLARYAGDCEVITSACSGLAQQIENGELASSKTRQMLQTYLQPLITQNCDVIVLGCTHYPFITPLLRELLPPTVQIIDTGFAVAKYLHSLFIDKSRDISNQIHFMSSLNAAKLSQILPQFWPHDFICTDLPNL